MHLLLEARVKGSRSLRRCAPSLSPSQHHPRDCLAVVDRAQEARRCLLASLVVRQAAQSCHLVAGGQWTALEPPRESAPRSACRRRRCSSASPPSRSPSLSASMPSRRRSPLPAPASPALLIAPLTLAHLLLPSCAAMLSSRMGCPTGRFDGLRDVAGEGPLATARDVLAGCASVPLSRGPMAERRRRLRRRPVRLRRRRCTVPHRVVARSRGRLSARAPWSGAA